MKAMRKTFYDLLSDQRIDVLFGEPEACERYLKRYGVEDSAEGYEGLFYSLEKKEAGLRRFLVWIRPDGGRAHIAGVAAHETLHLALALHQTMNMDADHLDIRSGVNEEPFCYHYERLFMQVWAFIEKALESAEGKKDTIKA